MLPCNKIALYRANIPTMNKRLVFSLNLNFFSTVPNESRSFCKFHHVLILLKHASECPLLKKSKNVTTMYCLQLECPHNKMLPKKL